MGTITTAFAANKELGSGCGVLSSDEWLDLSAFTDNAIYFYPSTEKMLRAAINLEVSEKLPMEFEQTILKYGRLKQYCQVFESEILPGTRDLAASVIQYARGVPSTYNALIKAILAAQNPGVDITLAKALDELSKQWKSSHPSREAEVVRGKFVQYIGILKDDAQERAKKATELHKKLMDFHRNLKSSSSEFHTDAKNYEALFGALSPEVKHLKESLQALQDELTGMRKQEDDFVIVLKSAPVYLLIPFFGYLVMAGVLLGVGSSLGVLRKKIWDKVEEAGKISKKLGPKEKFMAYYQYGLSSTSQTAKDVETAAILVERVKHAWEKITSDLGDLSSRLLAKASEHSIAGDWDVANLRLDTAMTTWQDLKADAERYLQYQLRRAEDLDDAMSAVVVNIAA